MHISSAVTHLEPDHAACIEEILLRHPKVKLISNEKAFMLMRQFGFHVDGHECIEAVSYTHLDVYKRQPIS